MTVVTLYSRIALQKIACRLLLNFLKMVILVRIWLVLDLRQIGLSRVYGAIFVALERATREDDVRVALLLEIHCRDVEGLFSEGRWHLSGRGTVWSWWSGGDGHRKLLFSVHTEKLCLICLPQHARLRVFWRCRWISLLNSPVRVRLWSWLKTTGWRLCRGCLLILIVLSAINLLDSVELCDHFGCLKIAFSWNLARKTLGV